ncbi:MAG: ATP-dependent Clp protease ATP-binding subunit [Clostridia bacterium]|nr:ATP-dependent Clp protease ATP-binding subunit [Clostridia bacterium]
MLCARCKTRPAVIFISKTEHGQTSQQGFCLKCARELNIGPINQLMDHFGMTDEDLDSVSDQISDVMENIDFSAFQPGGAMAMPMLDNIQEPGADADKDGDGSEDAEEPRRPGAAPMPPFPGRGAPQRPDGRTQPPRGKTKTKRKFISMYCTDLTAKARSGGLDRIIGRDREIYRAIQILCRRSKNNPCLIGEPGVGKTAVAEGLALKIAEGSVPAKLANKEIQMLDLTSLVAGTQFRGQFEARIKGLIDEVKTEGNIILFIDEVHSLVGTGDAEGSMNAANIMKPALSRGEIQVIGATTFTEYRKFIEKDSALERRFQPIKVDEPSIQETYEILKGIKDYYENYHRVSISDSLLFTTVTLAERYITDRFLPDKAIDLLDESCTCANLRNKAISDYEKNRDALAKKKAEEEEIMSSTGEIDYERLSNVRAEIMELEKQGEPLKHAAADNSVTEDDIARVIELWTGIPASKIQAGDVKRLRDLEAHLKARIIGQDEAVELVSAAIRRTRIQLSPTKRPASFIFVGPTGVGKTELVKQLSKELFDTPETLIRLDMSEFMEKHSVSRLIGSPPGYVGYDEAGQLTEKVRRKPYSVILFDEIEKAHPDVMNILLQILDEGKTNDAQGRTVDFSNCIIIMTSNAGSNVKDSAIGFARSAADASRERSMKALREFLRPEFIGRVDEIVVFNALTRDDYVRIARLLIDELRPAINDKGFKFTVSDDVYPVIAADADGGTRGARDLRNTIRRKIEDPVADIIISSDGQAKGEITVTAEDGEIKVRGE